MRTHHIGNQQFSFPDGLEGWSIEHLAGREFRIQRGTLVKTAFLVDRDPAAKTSSWWIDGDVYEVRSLRPIDALLDQLGMAATAAKGLDVLKAPMPGLVLRVDAAAGGTVEQGQTLLVLEAMKMENNLKSPVAGEVAEVFVQPGQAVEKGAPLLRFVDKK